ncbi:hypothetical protein EJP82_26055 [Paenibacillus anaericanus]|uniref:Uncharacterized protein n=1 Tax=Paenibacillus anaericanus TaxID=170367 RepID=A0A3S1E7B5_9BACL|nr:hypothetical protein [Paenibacillus anaericanus]RUT39497.1 hypothetical protein EJP82_26055 [Paenibacillus anaericanus]
MSIFSEYAITGIPLLDSIFTLVIKLLFAYFLVIMLGKLIDNYKKGNTAQFFVNFIVGIALLLLIIGPDIIAGWAGQLKTNLPK